MELGPIQKTWIASLREHPERQGKSALATFYHDGSYKACCLGELHLIGCKILGKEIIKDEKATTKLLDGSVYYLEESFDLYGLRDDRGGFNTTVKNKNESITYRYSSLAYMNDAGMTWPEIADYVETNPDNVFTKSV